MKIRKSWLLVLMLVQLAVLALPLLRDYWVRLRGQEFSFAVRPVDPRDPFRGRYVALGFNLEDEIKERKDLNCTVSWEEKRPTLSLNGEHRRPLYVQLSRGADNLARLEAVGFDRPSGDNYLVIKDYYCFNGQISASTIPFNRYYANEWRAPEIEEKLQDSQLTVAIYRGNYSVRRLEPRAKP